jgi:Ca2+-binding RTX toxin-like protein
MAIFNVKDYGALGNGLTNDTLAIGRAIAAASAAGGGQVYLPEGTYILSGSGNVRGPILRLADNVSLIGDGAGVSTLKLGNYASGTTALIETDTRTNVGLSNLTLDGNRDNNGGTVVGWYNSDATGVKIDGVEVKNFSGAGLRLTGTAGLNPRDIEVSNSSFHDNAVGVEALVMAGGVLHNNVAYNNTYGFNAGGAVQLTDNTSHDNSVNGLFVQGSGTTVSGGEVYANGDDGIQVMATHFSITGVDSHDNQGSGIYLNGSTYGTVSDNTVHNNALGGARPEIEVYGTAKVNANAMSTNNTISHNIITGSDLSNYGIYEHNAAYDNAYTDNVISHTTQGAIVAAASSQVSGNTDSILLFGSSNNDTLTGGITRDIIYGGAGNDTLNGGSNDDTLVGGLGVDKLTGGLGDDVFRFTGISDSYRTADKSWADVISDFDVAHDKIDLASSGLSLTTLGDGHNGTLLLAYNAAKDQTYLKNYDENSQGQRFELILKGNYLSTFSNANLQQRIDGASGNDHLTGTSAAETLLGGAGRDTLVAGAGDDRLDGGAGGDTLTGGTGADTFVFSNALNSVKTDTSTAQRDTITDFNALENDRIDLSGLGFTGLGNGYNGTLKVVLNAAGTLTALKSLEVASDGSHFEIMLTGNHVNDLNASNVIF